MGEELSGLLATGFVKEVQHPPCAKKEWEMADVCRLHKPEKGVPEGSFPYSMHRPGRGELLSFLDAYLGYHQIPLTRADQPATMFITPFGCFYYIKMTFRLKNAWPPINGSCNHILRNKLGTI
jgi:hypothetical protein